MSNYQRQRNEIIGGNDYFIIETGNPVNSKKILERLLRQRPGLKEVRSVDVCDVILVFCYIVSRAGTDIDAALNKLNSCSASKPAIFIVLHHTFEYDKVIPDSSRYVKRINTLTVDCLFNEDVGLLECNRNDEALAKILQPFKFQKKWNSKTNITLFAVFIIAIIILLLFIAFIVCIVKYVDGLV